MKNYKYILTHSSGNLTLDYNPVNWNEFNTVFRRSERYHSVLRSQILDLEFPLDGKAYIDTIYETYGIDTDIGCEIQYLDKSDFTYTTLFEGIIDLTEWTKLRDTTTVKVIDSSVMAKFAARDEVKVPINSSTDLDGNAVNAYSYLDTVTVTGVDIEQLSEMDDSTKEIVPNGLLIGTNDDDYYGVGGDFDINEIGDDATLPPESITLGTQENIYTNNSGGNIEVRYRIATAFEGQVDVIAAGSWTADVSVYAGKNGGGSPVTTIGDSGSGNDSYSPSDTYDSGWVTETLAINETIELYHRWTATGTPGDSHTPDLTTPFVFKPTFIAVYEITDGFAATGIEMPMIHELGAKLLEIITGVTDPLNAPVLGRTDSSPRSYGSDGDYSLIGIASGENLRRFDFDDKPLKTSFWDFFKSIDAIRNLGCWYDGSEFEILPKESYYGTSEILSLGEVKDLEISVAQDKYFNKVLCGYRDQLSYDSLNGNQTFCVPMEFSNDGKRLDGTLDIQSVYHADDYGIELARAASSSSNYSDDVDQDEQVFFLWCAKNGNIQVVPGEDYNEVTGLYAPDTRLNLALTSKRNLLQHRNQLSIPLWKSSGDTSYMSKQFELDIQTQITGSDPVIDEKDDLSYASLQEPLYYPELYNFTSELTNAHIAQLRSDPHGYVSFTYLGTTYQGYILEVSTEPFNRQGNWTLLRRNPNRT